MKVYTLKISTGFSNEPLGPVVSSYRSSPSASKVEHFRTMEARAARRVEIEKAVSTIQLAPWLISLEDGEFEIKD